MRPWGVDCIPAAILGPWPPGGGSIADRGASEAAQPVAPQVSKMRYVVG